MANVDQSLVSKWSREVGGKHASWEADLVSSFFQQGYESAWKHAAKHAVEKVLEIAEKAMTKSEYEKLKFILTDAERWE